MDKCCDVIKNCKECPLYKTNILCIFAANYKETSFDNIIKTIKEDLNVLENDSNSEKEIKELK